MQFGTAFQEYVVTLSSPIAVSCLTIQVNHNLKYSLHVCTYMQDNPCTFNMLVHTKYTQDHVQRHLCLGYTFVYMQQHLLLMCVCVVITSQVNKPLLALQGASMKHL